MRTPAAHTATTGRRTGLVRMMREWKGEWEGQGEGAVVADERGRRKRMDEDEDEDGGG